MSKGWHTLRSWSLLGLGLLVSIAGLGWYEVRARSWRLDLSLAREAMNAGRFGHARDRLSRLAEHWTNQGEVLVLLGECELRRGRRQEALTAWAKVPPTAPSFARAARFRASTLIQMGEVLAGRGDLAPGLDQSRPVRPV